MSEGGSVDGEVSKISYFEWKIENFFSTKIVAGKYIESPIFSYSGSIWKLHVYPKGNRDSKWIGLYLKKGDTDNAEKTLTFSLGMKNRDGIFDQERKSTKVFKEGTLVWGYYDFLYRDELQERKAELAPSDTVIFTCRVEDKIVPSSIEKVPQTKNFIEMEALSSDFNNLLISKIKSDVTIKVQDQEFQTHRTVLMARSPVFRAMFEHDSKEAQEGVVNEPDCDPKCFADFLRYLYTGRIVDVTFDRAHELYIMADKYDTQKLKSFCATFVAQNMTIENMCGVAILGELYDDTELTTSAQNFFNDHFSDILQSAQFKKLMRTHVQLAERLLAEMGSAVKSKKMTVSKKTNP